MSTNDNNDINDPIVQDVLNEFRDELLISKNNKDMNSNTPPLIIQDISNVNHSHPAHPSQPPYPQHLAHPSQPPYPQHPTHPSQPPYPQHPSHSSQPPYPQHPSHPSQHSQHPSQYDGMNKNDYMLYMDIELIKKNLIIVIIVFLIYFSGIINNIYERIPEYLQENIMSIDVYLKTGLLFIILYIISFIGYI